MQSVLTIGPMQESMTIREYLEWATIFPYSKDFFNLKKECFEIELMESYIDSMNYISNNQKFLESKKLTESIIPFNENEQGMGEKFLNKLIDVLKWFWKIFTAPFRTIGKFFRALFVGRKERDKIMLGVVNGISNAIGEMVDEGLNKIFTEADVKLLWDEFYDNVARSGMMGQDAHPDLQRTPQELFEPDAAQVSKDYIDSIRSEVESFAKTQDKASFLTLLNRIQEIQGSIIQEVPVPLLLSNSAEISTAVLKYLNNIQTKIMNLGKKDLSDQDLDFKIPYGLDQSSGTQGMVPVPIGLLIDKVSKMEADFARVEAELKSLITQVEDIRKDVFDWSKDAADEEYAHQGGFFSRSYQGASSKNLGTLYHKIGSILNELVEFSKNFNEMGKAAIAQVTEASTKAATMQDNLLKFLQGVQRVVKLNIEGEVNQENIRGAVDNYQATGSTTYTPPGSTS